jgi:hypothetical protein
MRVYQVKRLLSDQPATPRSQTMNNATLQAFRNIAETMQTAPTDWQWIGPHLSQRMFGITEERAKAYATRHGGEARKMVSA